MRPSCRNDVTRARSREVLVAIALVIAASCKQPEAPPVAISPPDLEIVSAGNEPRQLLRYRVGKDVQQRLELSITVSLDAGEVGAPMPTIVLTLAYGVDAVMPSGQMALHGTIEGIRAIETEGSQVPAAAMNGPLATLAGLTIYSVLSPNGRITGSRLDTRGKTVAPELEAQLQSLIRSFESTMMALPDEPVGVGAVWRNSRPVDQNGMKLKAVNSVTVRAIKGDVIEYTLDTDIHGADQSVTQQDVTIEIKDIVGSGAGKGSIDLGTLAVTSELAAELRSRMKAAAHDQDATSMTMRTRQLVRPL
jgi:hypothetical protein